MASLSNPGKRKAEGSPQASSSEEEDWDGPLKRTDYERFLRKAPGDFGLDEDEVKGLTKEDIDEMYKKYLREFDEDDGEGYDVVGDGESKEDDNNDNNNNNNNDPMREWSWEVECRKEEAFLLEKFGADTRKGKALTAIIRKLKEMNTTAEDLYKLLFSIRGSANSGSPWPINWGVDNAGYLSTHKKNILIGLLKDHELKGGFFFTKKKTRKRRKKKTRKKKKRNKKTKKVKLRSWSDTTYPYRGISQRDAIEDFLRLKRLAKGEINPRSTIGNSIVDWGTEKARRKTKYRNKSFVELWNNKVRRKKMLKFAKRLYKQDHNRSILAATRSAIDLQWGTVNTMRAAAAIHMYKRYNATRVLDFTAGWGARMIAAMALDIDYIGIDSNKALKPGYEKIIKLLKPYTKSKIKMYWSEAQKVNLSKVGKYDYVFTSPPYEYLEVYENMTNYEKKGSKIKQPSSSQKIKLDDSAKFYDEFLVPTLKNAYKYLPKNKFICLNMPDIMYEKIKKRWKKVTKCEDYSIVKRHGGPTGKDKRRGKELIFCWKKR